MLPKVRWLQEYYEVSQEDILEYRDTQGVGFAAAVMALRPELPPLLQYFDDETQEWTEVPTVRVSLGKRDMSEDTK